MQLFSRWLLLKGKSDQVEKIYYKMARMNGLQVTDEAISVFKELNVVKPEMVHHTSIFLSSLTNMHSFMMLEFFIICLFWRFIFVYDSNGRARIITFPITYKIRAISAVMDIRLQIHFSLIEYLWRLIIFVIIISREQTFSIIHLIWDKRLLK